MVKRRRRVKILAPVTSFEAAQRVISAGADEIYCGVTVPNIAYLGLSTRLEPCNLPTYDELAKVVNYAHAHGVKAFATTEFPFMAELIGDQMEQHINSYVQSGIDALIATDLGIVLLAKQRKLKIPLFASTYLASMNYEMVDFLKTLNVQRVVLERQLTISEIEEIVQHSRGVETEVFIHGSGCSNINVSCYGCPNLSVVDETTLQREILVTSFCQMSYQIYEVDGTEKRFVSKAPILDAYTWCSLCRLPELLKTGVTGLKIVGREYDPSYQGEITKIYCELVDLLELGHIEAYNARLDAAKRSWYVMSPYACRQVRCYYPSLFHAPYKIPV
jgi:putative protease